MLNDPVLPQLARALDSAQMARVFTSGHWRVESCTIERVKYKPGKNCLICYRLSVRDPRKGNLHEQRWCARFYESGGAVARYTKAQMQPLIPVENSAPLLYEPSLEMVAWRYPNERKMRHLAALSDTQILSKEILPKLARQRWGERCQIHNPQLELMHYAPEHTATVRVSLSVQLSSGVARSPWVVFGKTYYNGQGARTEYLMRQLWNSSARRSGELLIPRLLAYDSGRQTLWQEGLAGQTLLARWPDDAYPDAWLDRITASLAALHNTPVRHSGSDTPWLDDELALLRERSEVLASAWPSCHSALKRTEHNLQSQAGQLGNMHPATLHGDLHPANIFVNDAGTVALIDLDRARPGPVVADLASWMAAILYRALLRGGPLAAAQARNTAFWQAYCCCAPEPASPAALNWAIATALINERAFRCLTRLKPGRLALLDSLIKLADRISRSADLGVSYDDAA